MKRLLLFSAVFVFFLLISPHSVGAQTPAPSTPSSPESGTTSPSDPEECGGANWTIDPCPIEIDGNTPSVTITFFDLPDIDGSWHMCSIKGEGCHKAEDTKDAENGTFTVTVCGAGEDKLKEADDEGCGDGDYFHEGRVYELALYEDEEMDRKGPVASFFVNHYYPKVAVSNIGGQIEVTIDGVRGDQHYRKNRNNYQIVVEGKDKFGNDYKEDECVTVPEAGKISATFGKNHDDGNNLPLPGGKYLIKVNEQVNEGRFGFGRLRTGFDACNGGFTYWHINFEVGEGGSQVSPTRVCVPGEKGDPFEDETCIQDPNASDLGKYNKFINSLFETATVALPCSDGSTEETQKEGHCPAIDTAIGTIPTDFQGFINRLFTIVLSIAGVAAIGLIIYGGYTFMTSRGDPEKVKNAREIITAAVIGLLFIIFSFVILQVIAGDILEIPGFGSNPEYKLDTGIDRVDDGSVPAGELPVPGLPQ